MRELVVVTGISGFIARHIAVQLLSAGYKVRGTLRSMKRAPEVREGIVGTGLNADALEFAETDLGADAGWREALDGARFVQHVASPFPLTQPRGREDLVPAARDGAIRVVRTALDQGVERIVFTSSMVAMMYRAGRRQRFTVSESDWTDPDWRPATPYIISKTRAEKAMWDYVRTVGATERVAAINPGFVLGPPFGSEIGTSLEVIRMLMRGVYPAVPPISFPVVDVRDLAALHVAAMTAPGVGGRRLMASGGTASLAEMGVTIKGAFPFEARKVPTSELPAPLIRVMANFDRSLGTVLADLGTIPDSDCGYVTALTGVEFRPPAEAAIAAAQGLIDHRLI